MSESNTNILNLSEPALNSFKKSGLVQKILDLKGKVVVNVDQHKLCEKIEMKDFQKAENIQKAENMKLQSGLGSVKNVTHKLEEKMAYLKKKKQAKGEQYSCRSNIEISGISNSIHDDHHENTVVSICKDSGVEIDPKNIEVCHRLPLSGKRER